LITSHSLADWLAHDVCASPLFVRSPGLLYTLMCDECQSPDFDWDLAYNMSGDPLERKTGWSSFNYVLVISAVSVVAFGVGVALMVMFVKGRRRAAIDRDVARIVSERERARLERGEGPKPPELFEVGAGTGEVELVEIGKEYTGPIVVKYDTLMEAVEAVEAVEEEVEEQLSGGDASLRLSRSLSRATTNWTMTQIAVLDPEIGEEEVGEEEVGEDAGVVIEEVPEDDADGEAPPSSTQ